MNYRKLCSSIFSSTIFLSTVFLSAIVMTSLAAAQQPAKVKRPVKNPPQFPNIIDLENKAARSRSAREQDGRQIASIHSVEIRDPKCESLPFSPRCEAPDRWLIPAASGEQHDATGLAVSFGPERDLFRGRQISRGHHCRPGRKHRSGPGVRQVGRNLSTDQ